MQPVSIHTVEGKDRFGQISPTDISQFIRLEQCERYLRLRLHEKSFGKKFMTDYGVTPQPISPLLSLSGGDFEKFIEADVVARFPSTNFATEAGEKRNRGDNNEQVVLTARSLQ